MISVRIGIFPTIKFQTKESCYFKAADTFVVEYLKIDDNNNKCFCCTLNFYYNPFVNNC